MAKFEKQKPVEIDVTEKPTDAVPQKDQDQIVLRLHEALKAKEGKDSLYSVGDLMYETFKGKEYSPQNVLASVREVYNTNKSEFNPQLTFNQFIESFGPGMVKLCQQKLQEMGGYNLGKSGENKDGIDGKFGKKTKKALRVYYKKLEKPEQAPAKVKAAPPKKLAAKKQKSPRLSSKPKSKAAPPAAPKPAPQPAPESDEMIVTRVSYKQPDLAISVDPPKPPSSEYQPPANPEAAFDTSIEPYKPGTEKGTRTPLKDLNPAISSIYQQYETVYDNKSMDKYYGKTKAEVVKFNISQDPLTGKPVSFMGKELSGGISMEMYVFLKIAEAEIQKLHLKYVPAGKTIGGFEYRKMKMINGSDNGMSMHAYGAIDIDASSNDPKSGRGDIPDEVVMALVNAGLAWGGTHDKAFDYLGRDPMHFQLRFPIDSPQGLAIINNSSVGKKYWSVIEPMLMQARQKAQPAESPMVA